MMVDDGGRRGIKNDQKSNDVKWTTPYIDQSVIQETLTGTFLMYTTQLFLCQNTGTYTASESGTVEDYGGFKQ